MNEVVTTTTTAEKDLTTTTTTTTQRKTTATTVPATQKHTMCILEQPQHNKQHKKKAYTYYVYLSRFVYVYNHVEL